MLAEDGDPRDVRESSDLADRLLVLPDLRLDRDLLLRRYRLARKYRAGRGPAELDRPVRAAAPDRADRLHALVDPPARPLAGLGHLLHLLRLPRPLHRDGDPGFPGRPAGPLGFDFFKGWFYKGYSLFLDVFGAALIVGLGVMAVKRGVLRPFRLNYWRPDRRAEGEYDRARIRRSATGPSSASSSSSR